MHGRKAQKKYQPQQNGLKIKASIIKGMRIILKNNKNNPPINPKTKANKANNNEKINMKGVKANTINTNNSFKPNMINNNAMKISMTALR